MTKTDFLEALKLFSEESIKDVILPTKKQQGDVTAESRPAKVYKMRLPDSSAATKKAPYIIHQIITGQDKQESEHECKSSAVVRSIFCVYSDDEQEGGLLLLELMERLRIAMLRKVVIDDRFQLDLEVGVETLIYPDDTAPYFAGEMSSTWKMPAVEREVRSWVN